MVLIYHDKEYSTMSRLLAGIASSIVTWPFGFATNRIGASYSHWITLSMIPSVSDLINSSVTLYLIHTELDPSSRIRDCTEGDIEVVCAPVTNLNSFITIYILQLFPVVIGEYLTMSTISRVFGCSLLVGFIHFTVMSIVIYIWNSGLVKRALCLWVT